MVGTLLDLLFSVADGVRNVDKNYPVSGFSPSAAKGHQGSSADEKPCQYPKYFSDPPNTKRPDTVDAILSIRGRMGWGTALPGCNSYCRPGSGYLLWVDVLDRLQLLQNLLG